MTLREAPQPWIQQNGKATDFPLAVVLAAGKGTRLLPLTGEIPKTLAPVVDIPTIEHLFDLLAWHGFRKVLVNVHYLADVLLDKYGAESRYGGMDVRLRREEHLLGTAGGVKHLANGQNGPLVVISGDALTDIDLGDLVAFHRENEALATVALKPVRDTSGFGVVEVDEESNIRGFQEKPDPCEATSNLANAGIYVLEPEVLDYIPEGFVCDFAQDVFPRLLEYGERFIGYQGEFYWSDIGTPDAYRRAQWDVLSGAIGVRIPGKLRSAGLWACGSARLHPNTLLSGPVLLSRNAVVGRGVTLKGAVTVGSGCHVRREATVKRSVLLEGACVEEGAYLEDCIVGPGYAVRSGERIRGGVLARSGA